MTARCSCLANDNPNKKTVPLYNIADAVIDKMTESFASIIKWAASLSGILKKTVNRVKATLKRLLWSKMWRIFIQVYPIILEVRHIITGYENTSCRQIILAICLVNSTFYTTYDILKQK